jgi:hypothetical protein
VRALPITRHQFNESLVESVITNNFDNDNPRYFIRNNNIYILSGTIVAVTDGIRYVHKAWPRDITDVTEASTDYGADTSATAIGFPRTFHALLCRGISIKYKTDNNRKLSAKERNFNLDFMEKIDEFNVPSVETAYTGDLPEQENRGNNGWDY